MAGSTINMKTAVLFVVLFSIVMFLTAAEDKSSILAALELDSNLYVPGGSPPAPDVKEGIRPTVVATDLNEENDNFLEAPDVKVKEGIRPTVVAPADVKPNVKEGIRPNVVATDLNEEKVSFLEAPDVKVKEGIRPTVVTPADVKVKEGFRPTVVAPDAKVKERFRPTVVAPDAKVKEGFRPTVVAPDAKVKEGFRPTVVAPDAKVKEGFRPTVVAPDAKVKEGFRPTVGAPDAKVKEGFRPTVVAPDAKVKEGFRPTVVAPDAKVKEGFRPMSVAPDAKVTEGIRPTIVAPGGAGDAKPKKKEHMKIAESTECAADVKMFCSDKNSSDNFMILDCLQDDEKIYNTLSEECHNFLWKFKLRLTRDARFESASDEACATELEKIAECKNLEPGEQIPCLFEHLREIQSQPCKIFLRKMGGIIFSDYRFMNFFIKECKKDIARFSCGRIDDSLENADGPHSQGKTVACLNEHRKDLAKSCKKSLLRVAELQSDDYHLDRPLYYACKADRENLCHDVVAREGAVFKCLYKHLGDEKLSDVCRDMLEKRQQLIAEDVKADKSFYDACKEDIEDNKCMRRGDAETDSEDEDFSRSTILLCLQKAHLKKKIKPECLQEMFELRSELMQDYKISPDLVSACESEIKRYCDGLRRGGNTLQCLMKQVARSRVLGDDFSSQCKAEVSKIIHVANPGENFQLDAPLQRACGTVVTHVCPHLAAGHGVIITCLLENLDHDDMTEECEEAIAVIQYFAARDFRLDFPLFSQCQADAERLCHATDFNDPSSMSPDQGPLIFSCLRRHLRSNDPIYIKPSRACIHEIKRVMRERSLRINLMPEIEDACIQDLTDFCSENDEHKEVGGEMVCLQNHLEKLKDECKLLVGNFTEEQSDDIEMDKILMRACTPMIKRFCDDLLDSNAIPSEVLTCLITNKNQNGMNEKCAAGIERHQIISLKDFRFNMNFREACQKSVATYCENKETKCDVIACLSEHIRNDTLLEKTQRIDDRCKKQLKFELLQRGETIKLDPELEAKCYYDIEYLCKNKIYGGGEILECLRASSKRLSYECQKVIFQRKRDDAMFGDYTLLHVCKKMIKQYCDTNADEADILNCLKANKDNDYFNDRCRHVILRRQVEQAQDIRLNPHLQKACQIDIVKFCDDVYSSGSFQDFEFGGKVINCLKKNYASNAKILSKDCEHEIQSRVKEAALDINLSPVLMKSCKSDINTFCSAEIANLKPKEDDDTDVIYNVFGTGAIMECLKKHFKSLKDKDCQKDLADAIRESRIDVHVDPILNNACQQDLITSCKDIPQGQGRLMSCLLSFLDTAPDSLTRNCRSMLQRRKELWEYAAQMVPPETLSDILDQKTSSTSRNYFTILFTVLGIIVIIGLTFGCVMKRVRADKNNYSKLDDCKLSVVA